MYTPRGTKSRAKASPFTPTRSSRSNRQSGLFQTPTRQTRQSLVRTPGADHFPQTSQIWEETALHRVERYGLALPVLITEALTSSDRSSEISVSLDPSGWIWLVKGRKLYVWQFQLTKSGKCGPCQELTLPPSDLAHSAQRVCIVPSSSDTQLAACLAVSPEGVVRYWPNIAYEDSTLEISAELKGEECSTVINFQPYGCLLATTTSSLVLVSVSPGHSRPTCRPLKATQGVFSGIGRRMSSFIFGSSPLQTTGAPLQAIVSKPLKRDSRTFYVLSGTHLQKWSLSSSSGVEKLAFQVDADRLLREVLARKIWEQDSVQLPQLQMWLLDMQPISVGVMILCAGVNLEASQTVHYAVATLSADELEPPTHIGTFTILEHTDRYVEDDEEAGFLDLKLLVPSPSAQLAFVYSSRTIHIVPVLASVRGGPSNDKVLLTPEGNQVLGAGTSSTTPLFFSSTNGLFTVASSLVEQDSGMDESVTELLTRDLTSLAASLPHVAEMRMSEDRSAQLKAAFLCSLKGDVTEAQSIISEVFPETDSAASSEMDRAVATVSCDLIDDFPTADPRWAESTRQNSSGSSNSVIIIQQLRDKQKAHDYLVTFLKRHRLWDRLTTVMVRDSPMSTRLLLCEHTEKLEAAIALREIQSEYAGIVDNCICRVMEAYRDAEVPESLTVQDVFYREVSRIEEIVPALLDYENESLSSNLTSAERVNIISSINSILQVVVQSALQYRQGQASVYQAERTASPDPEYIPWTSMSSSLGIRTLLTKQFQITLQSGLPEAREVETRGELFQQLLGLADLVLDGMSSQLESLRRQDPPPASTYSLLQQKYNQERQKLISPFMEQGQYERAASLAEKYFDFHILIQLCEVTENNDRLQRYMSQFADKGFSNFLFNFYMKEGKRGKLLAVQPSHQVELRQFLEADNTRYLSWLHDIGTGNYAQAHETLKELARLEEEFLARKKTLLSLSKLAILADERPPENVETVVEAINEELSLILHQEQIPASVLEDIGLDPENMKVLTPEELIELYIGSRNPQASEYEFKKAMDLLQYIDRTESHLDYEKLQIHIWCRALLRDDWSGIQTSDPLAAVKETVFFKTIDLAYTEGCNLLEYLPPLEQLLTAEELGPLASSPTLRFLLQAGYEHIQRLMG